MKLLLQGRYNLALKFIPIFGWRGWAKPWAIPCRRKVYCDLQ